MALNERRDQLTTACKERREQLEASYSYQLFERDCDESEVWISEKLRIADDENYMDATNLQGTPPVAVAPTTARLGFSYRLEFGVVI